jgi:hypothetical protein
MVIKHGHLANTFAYAKQGERLGIVRVDLCTQSAGQDDIDTVVRLPGSEQDLLCCDSDLGSIRKQGDKRAVLHLLK